MQDASQDDVSSSIIIMESAAAVATRLQAAPNNGAYVLRELIRQVPLSADGEDENIHITCVEAWGILNDLYIYLHLLTHYQRAIYTLAPRPLRYSISCLSHPTQLPETTSLHTFLPQGPSLHIPINNCRPIQSLESSRYCCYHRQARRASSAMAP